MSEKSFDLRGLSCPEPVLRTRRFLEGEAKGAHLVFVVDSATSRDNVVRTLRNLGQEPDVEEKGSDFLVRLERR